MSSLCNVPWRDWIRTVEVEPSVYAADFSQLGHQVEVLLRAGARVFHFDVGDGHFVPPITMGPVVLRAIAPIVHRAGGTIDCHLMVDNPVHHFPQIAEAGGDSVTFHYEAVTDVAATIRAAREQELQVGLAFKPGTSPAEAVAAAEGVDLVLCMSIEPGYSGQEFLPETWERIDEAKRLLPDGVFLQVDGGIGHDNVRQLYDRGVDLLVVGSALFEREDLPRTYHRLIQALA